MKRSLLEKKLLIVEDERLMRNLLVQMIKKMGFKDVQSEERAEDVVNRNDYRKVDLLITDIEMEGITGLELIKHIREENTVLSPELPVIILTGLSQMQILMEAVELKIQAFLSKPVTEKILHEKIEDVLSKSGQLIYRDANHLLTSFDSTNVEKKLEDEKDTLNIENGINETEENVALMKNVLVSMDDLSAGMILEEDVIARGSIILRTGKVLQEGHIRVIRDLKAFIENKEILVSLTK